MSTGQLYTGAQINFRDLLVTPYLTYAYTVLTTKQAHVNVRWATKPERKLRMRMVLV
jgi:hypothetical protein